MLAEIYADRAHHPIDLPGTYPSMLFSPRYNEAIDSARPQ